MNQQRRVQTRRQTESPRQFRGRKYRRAQRTRPYPRQASPGAAARPPETSGGEDDAVMQMEGVYIISVAARILDMHPQTLRKVRAAGADPAGPDAGNAAAVLNG